MTITFLDLVNRVFLRIGEQRVNSVLVNEVSLLCGQNVNTAIRQICQDYPSWPWIKGIYTAQSWNLQEATLDPGFLSIQFVRDAGLGRHRLNYVSYVTEEEFFRQEPVAYTGTEGGAVCYTLVGEKLYVNPYPNDSVSQGNIKIHGSIIPSTLVADTDTLNIERRDEDLVIIRAAMNMAADHLKDTNIYRVYSAEYQRLLGTARTRLVTDITDKRRSAIY